MIFYIFKTKWMFCTNCYKITMIKYYDVIIPYCSYCKHDIFGSKIYQCFICGLDVAENKMHDVLTCQYCFDKCA